MATNRPQGDFIEWRINMKHFQLVKTIEISSLDKKTLSYPSWLWGLSPKLPSPSVAVSHLAYGVLYSSHQPVESVENGWLVHHNKKQYSGTYQRVSMLWVVSPCRPTACPSYITLHPPKCPFEIHGECTSHYNGCNRILVLPKFLTKHKHFILGMKWHWVQLYKCGVNMQLSL